MASEWAGVRVATVTHPLAAWVGGSVPAFQASSREQDARGVPMSTRIAQHTHNLFRRCWATGGGCRGIGWKHHQAHDRCWTRPIAVSDGDSSLPRAVHRLWENPALPPATASPIPCTLAVGFMHAWHHVTIIFSELRAYPWFVGKCIPMFSKFQWSVFIYVYIACRWLCGSGGPHPSRRCRASTRSPYWTRHPLRDPLHFTCK